METNLIKEIEDKYQGNPSIELLNGLVGAPIGGYGRKLDSSKEAEIIEMYSSGKNTTLIAKEIGVSRSTINRMIQTGNICSWPAADMIIDLLTKPLSNGKPAIAPPPIMQKIVVNGIDL